MNHHLIVKLGVAFATVVWSSIVTGMDQDPRDDFLNHDVAEPTFLPEFPKVPVEAFQLQFEAFGKKFVIDLEMNNFLSPNYVETYQENGVEVVYEPVDENERKCYYRGKIVGVEGSWAAISTCNGISGVAFDGEEIYYIEPNKQSGTGEIFVFKASERKAVHLKCGFDRLIASSRKNKLARTLHPKHRAMAQKGGKGGTGTNTTMHIEVILINDKSMYQKYKSNLTAVGNRARQAANAANAMYAPLNIVITILKTKTWTKADAVKVSKDYQSTLDNFLSYRKNTLLPTDFHDNAILFTDIRFDDDTIGVAYPSGMCDEDESAEVVVDTTVAIGEVASTVAHEMGHNLGMDHDDDAAKCKCPEKYCIMYSESTPTPPTKWSSCSVNELNEFLTQGGGICMTNKPAGR